MRCPFLAAVTISCGFVGCGFLVSRAIIEKNSRNYVEVRGLSEKVVRADIGNISITISNRNGSIEELYKKRLADKEKVIAMIESCGATPEEISCDMGTHNRVEEENTSSAAAITTKKIRYFESEDRIFVQSKDLDKIRKIKDDIVKLYSDGIFLTYTYSYRLSEFGNIKAEMMREASVNARKCAEAFLEPFGQELGSVSQLRQGEITIRAAHENEITNDWESEAKSSIDKRLRLVVRARFKRVGDS
ncbi:MAG: SIMPL domain-containing protein [Holosporaceae bacterium]|jgi:hypothetical protein|nr:SIMPL domain-containing protein [Holosporaceae bacterium]